MGATCVESFCCQKQLLERNYGEGQLHLVAKLQKCSRPTEIGARSIPDGYSNQCERKRIEAL